MNFGSRANWSMDLRSDLALRFLSRSILYFNRFGQNADSDGESAANQIRAIPPTLGSHGGQARGFSVSGRTIDDFTRGGRALRVALGPGLISSTPLGLSICCFADLSLRVNLSPFFHKLFRLFIHAAFEGFFFADTLLGGIFADVFGNLHRAKMRAAHRAEMG